MCFFIPLGFFFVVERTTYVGTDWWLSIWTDAANATPAHAFESIGLTLPAAPDADGQRFYATWYAAFVLGAAAFVVMRLHWFAHGYVRTARRFFARLVAASTRAPMVFFETTPLGRITNRYSFDTEVIDAQLFQRTNGVVASTSWLLGGIGVIVGSIPWMVLVLVPVFLLYFYLYRFYRRACVELQRLAAITRSPIHSTFQETLNGADSIRAFNVEAAYSKKNEALVDKHSRASVALQVASRWLSIRLETLGVMVVAGASFLSFFLPGLSAGIAGLAIMWASQLSMSLQFNTINLTEAESLMTSVERVLEYINVHQEPAGDTAKEHLPPKAWPAKGEIRFEEAVLSYRDGLPPALTGLSVTVQAGQKVGIVGRTGAGKSTIATALFRLRELTTGRIMVDGIDLATLGLRDVRGRSHGMAIITQDPLVFSGPIRFTLDPFDQHTDEDIWKALAAVQMRKTVIELWNSRGDSRSDLNVGEVGHSDEDDAEILVDALTLPIAEAGRNLSVGQRQLLCFARALLLQPRVIILDEATASVDYGTDRVIQTTLRQNFPGVTMLIIAHRLETIIDLDKILVMDDGKCVEYDTAATLLERDASIFSSLVDATGPETSQKLRQTATAATARENKEAKDDVL
jgi:ABC-type multidrug transport system fused ATPase/permease subunit